MYRTDTGKTFQTSSLREIAAGGEGRIFEYSKTEVVKIYHDPRPKNFEAHLKDLQSLPPAFVTPKSIVYTSAGEVAGFIMPYVNFSEYSLFNNLFNKGFCTAKGITYNDKIEVLDALESAVKELHKRLVVVGDLNQYNIFFKGHEILFVDVDSYQTQYQPHNGVLLEDIRDWSVPYIDPNTDIWAFDILAFWATTFCHPFKWVAPGNTETLQQRVLSCKSYLSIIPGIKVPPLYQKPDPDMERQFTEIFKGRRYFISFSMKHATAPLQVKVPLISADLDIRILYEQVTDMYAVSTGFTVKVKDTWYFDVTTQKRVVIRIAAKQCGFMFPSVDPTFYCYIENGKLYPAFGPSVSDWYSHLIQFTNGYLTVIDTDKDLEYNYNPALQYGGIAYRTTPVFAKSVIKRDALIQNFGVKKYLNIPHGDAYRMSEVPKGTKNAYVNGDYAIVEYKDRSRVKYMVQSVTGGNSFFVDRFSYFAADGNKIFIPGNGVIELYNDGNKVMEFKVPQCTESSALFCTRAGILMFENSTLYLLNTK